VSLWSDATFAARSLAEATENLWHPRLRIGVTGLARAGKTVFTTAMVHHLLQGTRLPLLTAAAEGRIARVRMEAQPDAHIPRFAYEAHLQAMIGASRHWPASTRRISQLRLAIDFERRAGWRSGPATLTLDIVDFPGEWLLDLALLDLDYAAWSREAIDVARRLERAAHSVAWLGDLAGHDPDSSADEVVAERAAGLFRAYMLAARDDPEATATTPPGRFLMPGDLDGSPALTFAPLDLPLDAPAPRPGSLHALMAQRYEDYKQVVAKPFFVEHFARLDRQIVLVDVLSALDAGPRALADLESALERVLLAFRAGRNTFWGGLFAPKITRVLFAATKADHIHHSQHDRLEAILAMLVARARARVAAAGAQVSCVALAAVRATREVSVEEGRKRLHAIAGVPSAGERVGSEVFDGISEAAVFPGELPSNPADVFSGALLEGALRFPRFRPPLIAPDAGGRIAPLPHIRLDKALDILIGDKLG
jgi:uncharacterized protein